MIEDGSCNNYLIQPTLSGAKYYGYFTNNNNDSYVKGKDPNAIKNVLIIGFVNDKAFNATKEKPVMVVSIVDSGKLLLK